MRETWEQIAERLVFWDLRERKEGRVGLSQSFRNLHNISESLTLNPFKQYLTPNPTISNGHNSHLRPFLTFSLIHKLKVTI